MLVRVCRQVADSPIFQSFILVVIGLASLLVGLETFDELAIEHQAIFSQLDSLLLAIFTVEVAIRMLAYGGRPWAFFKEPWNVFDFLTVAIFYLPFIGSEVAILRLARVVRMLRLIRALPRAAAARGGARPQLTVDWLHRVAAAWADLRVRHCRKLSVRND